MKAFPTAADNGHLQNQDGMDLRDYFAAKAIQGLMNNYKYEDNWEAIQLFDTANDMAELAYLIADEMMKVREQ